MITLNGLTLPNDLVWSDEFKYSSVAQNQQRTLTGGLIIQESTKLKGRKITLEGSENSGWISRQDLLTLQGLVDTVDNDMSLSFHGTVYTVRFDRSGSESPLDATPVIDCTDPDITAPYYMKLNLMTV